MSVANKDEALKCITIAKKAINDGNFEKARKFLLKSKTLHPLNEADGWRICLFCFQFV